MAHDLRRSIADRIQEQNTPKTDRFADYIRGGDGETGLPCWADILERFEEEFTDDRERELIWRALMAEGASRPLLVFIYTCVDRPDLRQRIREDVIQLPATIAKSLRGHGTTGNASSNTSITRPYRWIQPDIAWSAPFWPDVSAYWCPPVLAGPTKPTRQK